MTAYLLHPVLLSTFFASWLAVAVAPDASAQTLADRVLGASTDIVRMSFAAREGLCGNAEDSQFVGGRWEFRGRSDGNWQYACEDGPVRVQIAKDGRRMIAVRTYVGGNWRARTDATDLGEVSAQAASDWLLDLAASASPAVAVDAILPAAIADAPDPWQRLLGLGRDRNLSTRVRERAIFWVGQSAAREATRGLAEIVDNGTESVAVLKAAVFALSQRDDPERIDQLMRVARTHPNPEVVKASFFWLADSADERTLDFFEEVLAATQ